VEVYGWLKVKVPGSVDSRSCGGSDPFAQRDVLAQPLELFAVSFALGFFGDRSGKRAARSERRPNKE
jgi:hypothetical protein